MKELSIIDTLKKVGEEVTLYGWVDTKRDHKKIVFIDLRDRSGKIQIVGSEKFKELSPEDVVKITGLIKKRPEKLVNKNIPIVNLLVRALREKLPIWGHLTNHSQ